jgi:ethanolamine ammonia-lyase large subunit
MEMLAGIAFESEEERIAAKMALSKSPFKKIPKKDSD